MKPIFILVESNTSGTGRLFAKAAVAIDCEPVILACDPQRYGYVSEDGIRSVTVNTSDLQAISEAAVALGEQGPIRGVFTSSDYFTVIAAELARALSRPGADPRKLIAARNKASQYRAFRTAGLPLPQFESIVDVGEISEALRRIPLPVVVKPATGTGSVEVRKFNDTRAAEKHIGYLLTKKVNEREMAIEPGAIVMRFIRGAEYSIEVFSRTVVGVTKKYLSAEPTFVETGHDFPAELSGCERQCLESCALDAVDALGLDWGPVHVEARLTENGPMLIELNARLAGGFIPEIIRQAIGVDLVTATVRLAAGYEVDIAPRYTGAASIRFLSAEHCGTLHSISGIDEARSMEGIAAVSTYKKEGARLQLHGDFRDRIGHLVAVGPEVGVSACRANMAHSRLAVVVH